MIACSLDSTPDPRKLSRTKHTLRVVHFASCTYARLALDRAAHKLSGISITVVNTISFFCVGTRLGIGQSGPTAGGVDIYYYLSGHIAPYCVAYLECYIQSHSLAQELAFYVDEVRLWCVPLQQNTARARTLPLIERH